MPDLWLDDVVQSRSHIGTEIQFNKMLCQEISRYSFVCKDDLVLDTSSSCVYVAQRRGAEPLTEHPLTYLGMWSTSVRTNEPTYFGVRTEQPVRLETHS